MQVKYRGLYKVMLVKEDTVNSGVKQYTQYESIYGELGRVHF